MKRNEHLFQFTGKQIADAASAMFDHHMARMTWWKAEQQTAIARAKAAGFEVREYDAGSSGLQVNMVIDPEVTARLSQTSMKVGEHRGAADRYQIEAATYATQPERSYELQPDDVLYFRLAGNPRPE